MKVREKLMNNYNEVIAYSSALLGGVMKQTHFQNSNLESLNKGYSWDMLSPFLIYNALAILEKADIKELNFLKKDYVKSGITFTGLSLIEFAQKCGLYHGTYDSKDFIAYAVGTGLALGVDKTIKHFSKKKSPENKLNLETLK